MKKHLLICILGLIGLNALALPGIPPTPKSAITNIVNGQLISQQVITNGQTGTTLGGTFTGNGAGLTNLITGYIVPQQMPPTTVDAGGNIYQQAQAKVGMVFPTAITSPVLATNVQFYLGGNGQPTNASVWVIVSSTLPSGAFSPTNYTALLQTNITVTQGTTGTPGVKQSLAIPATQINSGYVLVCVLSSNLTSSAFDFGWYFNDANNTNHSRLPLWLSTTTSSNYFDYYQPSSYSFAGVAAILTGTTMSSPSSAATTTYSPANTQLGGNGSGTATTVQAAIDATVFPFAPTNCFLVHLGDSRSALLFPVLTNTYPFNQFLAFSNIAVGGTPLSFSVLAWQTNAASLRALANSGKTGIVNLWCTANDMTNQEPYSEIITYSNLVSSIVTNGLYVIAHTVQARQPFDGYWSAFYFRDVVNNYIRNDPNIWRVVDDDAIFQNCYDTNIFQDGTHYSNLALAICATNTAAQFRAAVKVIPPQIWGHNWGTNFVMTAPSNINSSNAPGGVTFVSSVAGVSAAANYVGNAAGLTNYYYPSNSWPANLSVYTNNMKTGDWKFANSNGWPVRLWYSNAVLQIEYK